MVQKANDKGNLLFIEDAKIDEETPMKVSHTNGSAKKVEEESRAMNVVLLK